MTTKQIDVGNGKQNKFILWIKNLSSYTKNKTINFVSFLLAFFIIGGTNYVIMFGHFVPTFFVLDFFIMIILGCLIFFFKTVKFDRIYLPILLFFITALNTINTCFFFYFGSVFSLKDLPYAFNNIGILVGFASSIPWWIVGVNAALFVFFAVGIVLYNVLWWFKPSKKELQLRRRRKIVFSLSVLLGSIVCFEISLQSWCAVQRSKGVKDVDYVNFSPNYHLERLGIIPYYVQEIREFMFDKGESVESIKNFLTDCSYVRDSSYNGILSGSNVISILLETGDNIMLNQSLTPNLWKLFYGGDALYTGGLCCNHTFSINHTDVSDIIGMSGNYPVYPFIYPQVVNMPFSISSILSTDDEYNLYYSTDISRSNDIYHRFDFMKQYGFNELLFHDEVIPEIEPWSFLWSDYTRDSLFINGLCNKMDEFPKNKPFFLRYLTVFMHMNQNITKKSKIIFDDLEKEFGETLNQAEKDREWSNPFEPGSSDWNKYRIWTLKTMDFDKGLGQLVNKLYGDGAPDFLKNTLIVICGDHHWYETSSNGQIFAKRFKNYDDANIRQYQTILGLYHPKISQKLVSDYPDRNFDKITTPFVVVPTILHLLGKPYNPRIYEGRSLFDPDYTNNEIFYSNWKGYYMNEHFSSITGHDITYQWDSGQTQENFLQRLDFIRKQLRILNTIYKNNIFATNDYSEFMPKN